MIIIACSLAAHFMKVKAYNNVINEAKMAFASEDYSTAVKLYSDSIKYSKDIEGINTLINEAEKLNTAKETFNLGKKLADDKDYLKAMEILDSAKIYKKTQAVIDFCRAAYIQENLNMAEDSASKKQFTDAILFLKNITTLASNNEIAINLKITYEAAIKYAKAEKERIDKENIEKERIEKNKAAEKAKAIEISKVVEKTKAIEKAKVAENAKLLTSKYKISVNTGTQKVEIYENEKLWSVQLEQMAALLQRVISILV